MDFGQIDQTWAEIQDCCLIKIWPLHNVHFCKLDEKDRWLCLHLRPRFHWLWIYLGDIAIGKVTRLASWNCKSLSHLSIAWTLVDIAANFWRHSTLKWFRLCQGSQGSRKSDRLHFCVQVTFGLFWFLQTVLPRLRLNPLSSGVELAGLGSQQFADSQCNLSYLNEIRKEMIIFSKCWLWFLLRFFSFFFFLFVVFNQWKLMVLQSGKNITRLQSFYDKCSGITNCI